MKYFVLVDSVLPSCCMMKKEGTELYSYDEDFGDYIHDDPLDEQDETYRVVFQTDNEEEAIKNLKIAKSYVTAMSRLISAQKELNKMSSMGVDICTDYSKQVDRIMKDLYGKFMEKKPKPSKVMK